jgi:hypothetical protein
MTLCVHDACEEWLEGRLSYAEAKRLLDAEDEDDLLRICRECGLFDACGEPAAAERWRRMDARLAQYDPSAPIPVLEVTARCAACGRRAAARPGEQSVRSAATPAPALSTSL